MATQSAGILLYRLKDERLEVLLVHPGGPLWTHKDLGSWSVPKGQFQPGEEPLEAAKREFLEETGVSDSGKFIPLTPAKQPAGKTDLAWPVKGPGQARAL